VNLLPESAKTVVKTFHRQALHAYLLAFEHPRTGEVMEFDAPMPNDMRELIEALQEG
jgi:23S rRNA pseudouridine1911/1915/1917 synthase